jgi:hypothetical protein
LAVFATEDFTVFDTETFFDAATETFVLVDACFFTVTWADFGPLDGLTFFLQQLS